MTAKISNDLRVITRQLTLTISDWDNRFKTIYTTLPIVEIASLLFSISFVALTKHQCVIDTFLWVRFVADCRKLKKKLINICSVCMHDVILSLSLLEKLRIS